MARARKTEAVSGDIPQCLSCGARQGVRGGPDFPRCLRCVSSERMNDPLFRCYMTVSGLVNRGEMTQADAVGALVKRADELGRPRPDIGEYVPLLRNIEQSAATVKPWHL